MAAQLGQRGAESGDFAEKKFHRDRLVGWRLLGWVGDPRKKGHFCNSSAFLALLTVKFLPDMISNYFFKPILVDFAIPQWKIWFFMLTNLKQNGQGESIYGHPLSFMKRIHLVSHVSLRSHDFTWNGLILGISCDHGMKITWNHVIFTWNQSLGISWFHMMKIFVKFRCAKLE